MNIKTQKLYETSDKLPYKPNIDLISQTITNITLEFNYGTIKISS